MTANATSCRVGHATYRIKYKGVVIYGIGVGGFERSADGALALYIHIFLRGGLGRQDGDFRSSKWNIVLNVSWP